ncbi:MAG TPA: bifunctional anthranilate synthase component II/anthranilate phosphoribosyltransferase [Dehalococcoidia bacterium]|nr:bifunctional anthranilate synthase component II/anthranilate phosphoribosyltransferase [Dehalococcoidia bacterium]
MLLLIDNYDSFTYNLYQFLCELGADVRVVRNDEVTVDEVKALRPERIVISPGPGRPEDAGISIDVVREMSPRVPVLGVCLGHQAIGVAFGGTVSGAAEIRHGKASQLKHDGRGVFLGVDEAVSVIRYHSLAIEGASLPAELEVSARAEDGTIMGVRHHELPVEGVQFHPESVLSEQGKRMLANFLELSWDVPEVDELAVGKEAIAAVVAGNDLTQEQAAEAMGQLMSGRATPAQIGAFLTGLRLKGETVEEIAGMATAMRERAARIKVDGPLLDTCGTGGDNSGSVNVSTAAAFVAAGAGARVAKHGNRAMSSGCGSADVLEALGARIDLEPEQVATCIDEIGIGFLFAQKFHPAMKHVAPARREIGIRSVFNILGPLTNPAGARHQVLGVANPGQSETMVQVLKLLGSQHALVVHGNGMDELTTTGSSTVFELKDGEIRQYEVSPTELGLAAATAADLHGGSADENASRVRAALEGERGPVRDIVMLNAAAALVAADLSGTLAEGLVAAADSIDSGRAAEKLSAFVEITQALAGEMVTA